MRGNKLAKSIIAISSPLTLPPPLLLEGLAGEVDDALAIAELATEESALELELVELLLTELEVAALLLLDVLELLELLSIFSSMTRA